MIWASRRVEISEGAIIFDKFEQFFFAGNAPKGTMLVCSKDSEIYYISLGDERFLQMFPGFTEIDRDSLPKEAVLLIGSQNDFEEFFNFPKR